MVSVSIFPNEAAFAKFVVNAASELSRIRLVKPPGTFVRWKI
jgi:hypothetical protein